MSAARANVQEFSAKVSKSVAAVGVASALLASVRLESSRARTPIRVSGMVMRVIVRVATTTRSRVVTTRGGDG